MVMLNIQSSLLISIALKLRENWRVEAAQLPAPARMAAFTLIELSIILVIIGLLVGGVLVGQDMIRAAEIRALKNELHDLSLAVQTFKLKYNCYPGDCDNATSFFGKNSTLCNSHTGQPGSPGTCNGNGNNMLFTEGTSSDGFYFWQHLTLANLVKYPYNDGSFDLTLSNLFKKNMVYVSTESVGNKVVLGIDLADEPIAKLVDFDRFYDDGTANTGRVRVYGVGGDFYPTDPKGCIKSDGNYSDDLTISISEDQCYIRINLP